MLSKPARVWKEEAAHHIQDHLQDLQQDHVLQNKSYCIIERSSGRYNFEILFKPKTSITIYINKARCPPSPYPIHSIPVPALSFFCYQLLVLIEPTGGSVEI